MNALENKPSANEALVEYVIRELYTVQKAKKVLIVGPATLDRDPSPLFFAHELAGTNTQVYCLDLPKNDRRGSYRNPDLLKRQLEQVCQINSSILMPEILLGDIWVYGQKHAAEYDVVFEHMTASFLLQHGRKETELIKIYRHLTRVGGIICLINNSSPHFSSNYQGLMGALASGGLETKVIEASEDVERASKYPILIDFYFEGLAGNLYAREPPYKPIAPQGVILPRPPGKTQHKGNVVIVARA